MAGGQGRGNVSVYQTQPSLFPTSPAAPAAQIAQPASAQSILAVFIDSAAAAGITVPRRTIGMFAREIKTLLDDGCTTAQVAGGMARMVGRRKIIPSLLANFVLEAQLPAAPARRFGRGLTAAQIAANGQRLPA